MLNIHKTIENGTAVFALEGRLDTITSRELDEAFKASLDGVSSLTLDMEQLEYISSAGLRVVLAQHLAMSEKGGMKVIHVKERIMEIFEVTGFSNVLNIEE